MSGFRYFLPLIYVERECNDSLFFDELPEKFVGVPHYYAEGGGEAHEASTDDAKQSGEWLDP